MGANGTRLVAHGIVFVYIRVLQAIGVELDLTDKGLGVRSRRYAMLVDDGTVCGVERDAVLWHMYMSC